MDAWLPDTMDAAAAVIDRSLTAQVARLGLVTLLGDGFAADPSGFARMLGDTVVDGLVNDPAPEGTFKIEA